LRAAAHGAASAAARPSAAPRQPAAGRCTLQGTNQYRRVALDAFFAAQRARVAEQLDQHEARVRARLRATMEDDMPDQLEVRRGLASGVSEVG